MLSSGCTGWDPNVAEIAVADSIMGTWKTIGNPCTGPDADKNVLRAEHLCSACYRKEGRIHRYVRPLEKERLGRLPLCMAACTCKRRKDNNSLA